MFTSRTARLFGLGLFVFFLSAGLTSVSVEGQDKKDDKKKVKSKLKVLVPQDDAKLLIEGLRKAGLPE